MPASISEFYRLNNRKAKLARAAREARPSEGENTAQDKVPGSSSVPFYDSPESTGDDYYVSGTVTRSSSHNNAAKYELRGTDYNDFASQQNMKNFSSSEYVKCKPGQYVALVDGEGIETGRGKVYQVEGIWQGMPLEEEKVCVVDITDLKVDKQTITPYPWDITMSTTFRDSERLFDTMRVAWDASKIIILDQ